MDQSLANRIIAYEAGGMSAEEQIDFFADLVRTSVAWELQGSYGRMATTLIHNGYIDQQGNVLRYPEVDG